MPQGRCTALPDDVFKVVAEWHDRAAKHGMEYEWLQWFVGGLVINKLSPEEAAVEAALEWDLL